LKDKISSVGLIPIALLIVIHCIYHKLPVFERPFDDGLIIKED
jgi:hypothetical protein